MENNYIITTGTDNKPQQFFNGKSFKLQKGEHYFNNGEDKMHTYVWEHYNGKVDKGYHIHHIDGNKSNNKIENLEKLLGADHLSAHGKKRYQENPEWFKKFREGTIAYFKNKVYTEEEKAEQLRRIALANLNRKDYGFGNCEHCGKNYHKGSWQSRFCHSNCKQAVRRKTNGDKEERECIVCNNKFLIYKYNKTKYTCSCACSTKNRWKIKKNNVVKNTKNLSCAK